MLSKPKGNLPGAQLIRNFVKFAFNSDCSQLDSDHLLDYLKRQQNKGVSLSPLLDEYKDLQSNIKFKLEFRQLCTLLEEAELLQRDKKYSPEGNLAENPSPGRKKSSQKYFEHLIYQHMSVRSRNRKDCLVDKFIQSLQKIADLNKFSFQEYGSSEETLALEDSVYRYSVTSTNSVETDKKLLKVFYNEVKKLLQDQYQPAQFEIQESIDENNGAPFIHVQFDNININFYNNNKSAVLSSRLLQTYAKFDGRCRKLCLLIKIWAKIHKITGTKSGFLSNYALNIMVINFLQTIQNPILPNLQAERIKTGGLEDLLEKIEADEEERNSINPHFEDNQANLQKIKGTLSPNESGIRELLKEFFKFISERSNRCDFKFDIKQGKLVKKLKAESDLLYSIQDPFEAQLNLGAKLKRHSPEAKKFLDVAKKSLGLIRKKQHVQVFQEGFGENCQAAN